jgi:hypothetical protein
MVNDGTALVDPSQSYIEVVELIGLGRKPQAECLCGWLPCTVADDLVTGGRKCVVEEGMRCR